MTINQVAAQFYTIRAFCQTTADFAESCRKTRAIGYTAVQLSGIGPIPESEIVRICQGEGLTICATHESAATILKEPGKIVERLQKLDCTYTSYPWPQGIDLGKDGEVRELVRGLDAAGAVLREAGRVLTYHNHAIEFLKHDGTTVLDIIFRDTDARNLQAELDTYWVQLGGADPVEWCEKLNGRLPLLHLKDCVGTTSNAPLYCEIGNGNLNFKKIIAAGERSGCRWFIVEQDVCPGDPFESLKISYDYIAANLVS